ncbi:MAG TPA: NAD(P)H-dependent oxidoreductase subunit E, partial [Levilinea sp.]|nr:NAD(P)H-dependent oxidoreductase subunit E [Levilinea sp.]
MDFTMRRNGYAPSALVEALHSTQESFGHISLEALKYVADCLNVPPSKAMGVLTFYNLFNMTPLGEHVLTLCTGTACYVRGADQITDFLREEYGLKHGQTTPDGKLSFIEAR